jgi:hypothetical protein
MADFSVNATQLSAPQGQGANVLAPVREMNVDSGISPIIGGIVDIFAKGLTQNRKDEQEARKRAVVGSYAKELSDVNDALLQGKDASWAGLQTRKITNKYLASSPEYTTELVETHRGFVGGTEIGEAQKKVEQDTAIRNADKSAASGAGFTFYSGMGVDAENRTIDAHKTELRVANQLKLDQQRATEERAQRADTRAEEGHAITINDHLVKENAAKGLLEIANSNFDAFGAMTKDLIGNQSLNFDQKTAVLDSNLNRIRMGIVAVSKDNPSLAAPFQTLFDNMESTVRKIIDPKVKTANELATLKTEYESQIYKSKLLAISDPGVKKAVVATELFKDPALLTLSNSPAIKGWLARAGMGPEEQETATPKMIGTVDEKAALSTFQSALRKMNTGSTAPNEKAKSEAVNAANTIMQQTADNGGSLKPEALKNLSAFYASSEFGKLSQEGKIDMPTMQNAKKVFQITYEPAVKAAILDRLDQPIGPSTSGGVNSKIIDHLDITFSGGGVNVAINPLKASSSVIDKITGKSATNAATQALATADINKSLKDAQAGLNQLIHMGAHLEGTTDYQKYWEKNKHLILPGVFISTQPGQTINGYIYNGGDARNQANYTKVTTNGGQ